MIPHSLLNKEYFWSYDEKSHIFSHYFLCFSGSFNRNYLKLIKMDISAFAFKLFNCKFLYSVPWARGTAKLAWGLWKKVSFIFLLYSVLAPDSHNCDFESGYCTWTQDGANDFNWTRASGTTGSGGTGPPGDHTTGDATGRPGPNLEPDTLHTCDSYSQ